MRRGGITAATKRKGKGKARGKGREKEEEEREEREEMRLGQHMVPGCTAELGAWRQCSMAAVQHGKYRTGRVYAALPNDF